MIEWYSTSGRLWQEGPLQSYQVMTWASMGDGQMGQVVGDQLRVDHEVAVQDQASADHESY